MQRRIEGSRLRTKLTTQTVRWCLLDGKKAFWWLFVILEPVRGPLLTDPKQKSKWWRASLEKILIADWFPLWTFRSTSWKSSSGHQQGGESSDLLSSREHSQEQVAPHWGKRKWWTSETAQLEEEGTLPFLWVTQTLSDHWVTKKQRPATGARPLTGTRLLELSSSIHK